MLNRSFKLKQVGETRSFSLYPPLRCFYVLSKC